MTLATRIASEAGKRPGVPWVYTIVGLSLLGWGIGAGLVWMLAEVAGALRASL